MTETEANNTAAVVGELRYAGKQRARLVEKMTKAEQELEAAIVAAFDAGLPKLTIAREAEVARQTVYNVLARQGRE